jgi:hypothetical protein
MYHIFAIYCTPNKAINRNLPPDSHTISLCIITSATELRGKGQRNGKSLLVYLKSIKDGLLALITEAKVRRPSWILQPGGQATIDNHLVRLIRTNKL